MRDGDEYVLNGRKWWSTGAGDARCKLAIFMGKTDPDAPRHLQQSIILVPMDAPGVKVERMLNVFGYDDAPNGHAEISFTDVRVPKGNLLLGEGRGFEIAQGRLGPGRIHHCMRSIGAAERALEFMCKRLSSRHAFGKPISQHNVWHERIAESRIMIEQARLLVLKTAWLIDHHGARGARTEIAAIKVVAPEVLTWVADRAMQLFGGAGFTEDFPLAEMYAMGRWLHIADGPDEVHRRSVARAELGRLEPGAVPDPYRF